MADTAYSSVTVTPSDSAQLPSGVQALYVGTGGDVVVVHRTRETVKTFKNVASGSVLPIRCVQVYATGTTATDILALY